MSKSIDSNIFQVKNIDGSGIDVEVDESQIDHENIQNNSGVKHIDWTNTSDDFKTTGNVVGESLNITNGTNAGSGVVIDSNNGNNNISLIADITNNGNEDHAYDWFTDETTGNLVMNHRDLTNGFPIVITKEVLKYEHSPTDILSINNITNFLNGQSGLNANSQVRISTPNGHPGITINSDTGGGTERFDIYASQNDGHFYIEKNGGITILRATPTAVRINEEITIDASSISPVVDQGQSMGSVTRRYLDMFSFFSVNSGSGDILRVQGDGRIVRDSSDLRLKKNINPIGVDWTKFNSLEPKSFNLKTNDEITADGNTFKTNDDGTKLFCGFVADDVESVYPDCSNVSAYDGVKSYDINGLFALAVKHIQDCHKLIQSLEARVTALEP